MKNLMLIGLCLLLSGCGSDGEDNSSSVIAANTFVYSGTVEGDWQDSNIGSVRFVLVVGTNGAATGEVYFTEPTFRIIQGYVNSEGHLDAVVIGNIANIVMQGELHTSDGYLSGGIGDWYNQSFKQSGRWGTYSLLPH